MEKKQNYSMAKAILTDIQFWIPIGVLIIGIFILVYVSMAK
jgi:hypothetical protein